MIVHKHHLTTLCLCLAFVAAAEGNPRAVETKPMNKALQKELTNVADARWNYAKDASTANENALNTALENLAKLRLKHRDDVMNEATVTREIENFAIIGEDVLVKDVATRTKFEDAKKAAQKIIDQAKVKEMNVEQIREQMKNLDAAKEAELKSMWSEWHKATGPKTLPHFEVVNQLGNQAAKDNQFGQRTFDTLLDLWLADWEMDKEVGKVVQKLAEQLRPLYGKLHAAVRVKLGEKKFKLPKDNTIPAHLLGDLWPERWTNLIDSVKPYNVKLIDDLVAEKLAKLADNEKGNNLEQMFKMAQSFVENAVDGVDSYWDRLNENSLIGKTSKCQTPQAIDFYNLKYSVVMCAKPTLADLMELHRQTSKVAYYIKYNGVAAILRRSPTPAFLEAVADMFALFASRPQHLKSLLQLEGEVTEAHNLNHLMKLALEKVPIIQYAFVVDKFRAEVLSKAGTIVPGQLNRRWWQLMIEHMGISPPVKRTASDKVHFDFGSNPKHLVEQDYTRYLASSVLQFQLHQALCDKQEGEAVYLCNMKTSVDELNDMLSEGAKSKWTEVLAKVVTPAEGLKTESIVAFFEPLVKEIDKNTNLPADWTKAKVEDYFESASDNTDPNSTTTTTKPEPTTSGSVVGAHSHQVMVMVMLYLIVALGVLNYLI